MVPKSKLVAAGAHLVSYRKGEIIFLENSRAGFYFQINSGSVKMLSFSPSGEEVVQKIVEKGDGFGESSLLEDFPYPARAVALNNCLIWRLPKSDFIQLLDDEPALHLTFTKLLRKGGECKVPMLRTVSLTGVKESILSYLDLLAQNNHGRYDHEGRYIVPYTRQQIANSLGLRVETVISALGELVKENELKIINRKICRAFKGVVGDEFTEAKER